MLKRLRLIALAGLLICNPSAPAAVSVTNSYIVWNTEKDELLPQSSVIAMTQTRDGYLWLGTMKGLVRFDGLKADVFDPLVSMTIVFLFEDSRGGL
ncbi:MAG: hypothetical protein HOP33_15195, partial [Verrucomicrobia bacterium]|nr:hypothetical protein [Verrucomicrobiota bacterium]